MLINTTFHGEFAIEQHSNQIRIKQAQRLVLEVSLKEQGAYLLQAPNLIDELWLAACWALFETHPQIKEITIPNANITHECLIHNNQSEASIHCSSLAQYTRLWVPNSVSTWYPQLQILDQNNRYHPARPNFPDGEIYRRFDTSINAWISLQTIDIEKHSQLFSQWQNSQRVAKFWDHAGSLKEHIGYLESLLKQPKTLPVIGLIDDEPFAYFEIYWAKEDRIAPYYNVQDFDRGIHMLVGSEKHRGPHKVKVWLTSLCHFIFLNDARTQSIVSEPRADNQKIIGYLQTHRFNRLKEFNFPHKRAALMHLSRDAFFDHAQLITEQTQENNYEL